MNASNASTSPILELAAAREHRSRRRSILLTLIPLLFGVALLWQVATLAQRMNTENQDENGITAGPKAYIFDITRRWMDPDGDGDPGDGLDGWRLDVAFCIRHPFWKDWRRHVKSINPDAYLVAEIVFEDPNEDYLQGDEFDAVMNYAWGFAYAGFFAQTQNPLSASHFVQTLHHLRELHPAGVAYGMQNLLDSHDTARIASHGAAAVAG